ncbi:TetR/AcrR family transcriptional regulator [Nocardiopsis xinjiangensis]|uniref:TetR/AcrR family transcriptional regulator n=1 Tax=Nocardiopsis xinjiangensis TaxID=124285 RepID=UPI000476B35E|nr:TetR-like C-terminal domain-containing protein [Nocardiopsis xinjiangensis]
MPRAGVTPERVAREAALLSDEEGFDALTLSGVAQRFGVSVPSLYKHVEGLTGLRRAVARSGVQELGACLREAVDGRSGADAWRAFAHAYRYFAHTRPGRYTALQRAPLLPSGTERAPLSPDPVSVLTEVLQGLGVTEGRGVPVIRALRSALHGFVDLEANGGFGLPEDVDTSFDVLVEGCVRMVVPDADDHA